MAWTLVTKNLHQSTNSNGFTCPPFDSSGADTHFVGLSRLNGTTPVITDNGGYIWVPLTASINAPDFQWVYAVGTGRTGHTITITGSGIFSSIVRYSFSGGDPSPLDASPTNNLTPSGTSVQPGAQTPSVDNCLILLGGALNSDNVGESINGGFSSPDSASNVGGAAYGIVGSYLIQTIAASANPTLSWTNAQGMAVSMAVFKSGAAAVARVPYQPNYQMAPIMAQ